MVSEKAEVAPVDSSESWFSAQDVAVPGTDPGSDILIAIKGNKSLAAVLETEARVREVLNKDSMHLLRTAQNVLSKANMNVAKW